MCGIVGVAGKVTKDARDAFDSMLLVCQLRGKHATGVITVKKNNERDWFKVAGPSNVFLDNKKYTDMSSAYDKKVFIGHCRHATIGNTDDVENAHPFEHDHIVGVHNGTLDHTYRWKLDRGRDLPVDSSALMYNIAKNGPEATFGSIEGAWACVWWDMEEKTINFLRNNQRPLFIAHSDDNELMFWASEPWMLLIVERHGVKLGRDDKGCWFTALPTDELWSIEVDAHCTKNQKVFKAKIRKVEGDKPKERRYPFLGSGGANGSETKRGDFPFQKPGDKPPQAVVKPGTTVLVNPFEDDEIPDFMQVPKKDQKSNQPETQQGTTKTAVESPNLITSTTPSAKDIVVKSGPSEHNSSTSNLKTPVSSQKKRLLSLAQNSKKEAKEESTVSSTNVLPFRAKSIHRKIHGVGYVTDTSGNETEEATLWKKTGGKCCFCKQTVNSIKDVAEVYDKGESMLCVPCITDWDMSAYKKFGD